MIQGRTADIKRYIPISQPKLQSSQIHDADSDIALDDVNFLYVRC